MTDGPNCATCGATLVAGNQVVRITSTSGQQHWTHAGPCRDRVRLPVDQIPGAVIDEGRLAVVTEYLLDTEIAREKDTTP